MVLLKEGRVSVEALAGEVRIREDGRTLVDYDCCQIPSGWISRSLKMSTKDYNRLNRGRRHVSAPGPQLLPPVPGWVWGKLWEASPVFGLSNISVAAPAAAFRDTKLTDPLIVGTCRGKWYFIAAWNLDGDAQHGP